MSPALNGSFYPGLAHMNYVILIILFQLPHVYHWTCSMAASEFRPSKMALWSKYPNTHLLSSSNIMDRMSRTWPTIFMEGFLLRQLHRDVTQSLEQSTSWEWALGSNILRRINSSSSTCNEWLCEREWRHRMGSRTCRKLGSIIEQPSILHTL